MPLQPALTNGSVKTHRPILKWALVALGVIWLLAIIRIEFVGRSTNSASKVQPATQTAPLVAPPASAATPPASASSTGPSDQNIQSTLASFIPAWLTPGTPAQREAALAPTTEPHLLSQLVNVPPDALPQGQLAGTPQVNSETASTAIATATLTDGTFIAMRLESNPDGSGTWLVTDIDTPAGPST